MTRVSGVGPALVSPSAGGGEALVKAAPVADLPPKTDQSVADAARRGARRAALPACVCLGSFVLVFVTLILAAIGCYQTETGRSYLHRKTVLARTKLSATPAGARGVLWSLQSFGLKVVLELPDFLVGFFGDRTTYYRATADMSDSMPVGFRDGFVSFDFASVDGVMSAENQPRGPYLGAAKVPSRCMGPDTLIFMGTGPTHTAIRKLLLEQVPAFNRPLPGAAGTAPLALDLGADLEAVVDEQTGASRVQFLDDDRRETLVKRAIIRTLYRELFNATISDETLADFEAYATWGGLCVLGSDFHALSGGLILRQVNALRARIRTAIAQTEVGRRVKAAAEAAVAAGTPLPFTSLESAGDALVRQLADGAAFAGMLGTTHLTTHALARLRSDPAHYVPLFEADPVAFLHEEARLDPPVASTTAVVGGTAADVTLGLKVGPTTFAPGTPFQVSIATANVDPRVFGGALNSKRRALLFDPRRTDAGASLSWNGRLTAVAAGTAPRGCPGYRLSMALAKAVVTQFAPPASALPVPYTTATAGARIVLAPEYKNTTGNAAMAAIAAGAEKAARDAEEANRLPPLLDRLGFFVWLCCCTIGAGYLVAGGIGAVSARYLHYLLGQALVSFAFVTNSSWLLCQAQIFSGVAYALIFITVTCQHDHKRGMTYSAVVWGMWALTSSLLTVLHVGVGPISTAQAIVNLFYGVCAAAGLSSVVMFRRLVEADPSFPLETRRAAVRGVWGAVFGLVDLLPIVCVPVFGMFMSRIMDSTLYVPFLLGAIRKMDAQYKEFDVVLPRRRTVKIAGGVLAVMAAVAAVGGSAVWRKIATHDICAFNSDEARARLTPLESSLCTQSPLAKVDSYGRFMFGIVRSLVNEGEKTAEQDESPKAILEPKYDEWLPKVEVIPGTGWVIPTVDEDVEGQSSTLGEFAKHLIFDVALRDTTLFPISDDPTPWHNLEHARMAIKIAAGEHLPAPVAHWNLSEATSDETIARMAFSGLAGGRVVTLTPDEQASDSDNATYVVSFNELAALPVRRGYERFGAAAYFDASQKLLRIYWAARAASVKPGDLDWNHAKHVWRCSALLGITATEHLLGNHLIYSNIGSTVAREALPKDHPLRRFLKPHNHRTPSVNLGAARVLTVENGLLHRAVGLTYGGLRDAFLLSLRTVRLQGNPLRELEDEVERLGLDFPFGQDGVDLYRVIHKYAQDYVDVYYADDEAVRADQALGRMWRHVRVGESWGQQSGIPPWHEATKGLLVNFLASYIFQVTGNHHAVGNVAEYMMTPEFACARLRPGSSVCDVEASHYGMLIAILTGTRAPKLMGDYEHLVLMDDHHNETVAIMRRFQQDLADLARTIDERNAVRKWPFWGFHPARLLTSVSI